jgi:aryl-alcohol dehydrogenase-like predicted oxidoreductase
MSKVPKVNLGSTGLKVSKLGFGTFDFGVPSLNVTPEEGSRILIESYKLGVNFWDTSDDYGSNPHVAFALRHIQREEVVISTKTYLKSAEEAKRGLQNSLKELGTEYTDIFLLHVVKHNQVDRCRKVLKELKNAKAVGIVKAIGLSTHSAAVVRDVATFQDLDIIMTICCEADQAMIDEFREHIPLEDGSIGDMFGAIEQAHDNGKGIIAMKVLGDGALPLISDYQAAIRAIGRLKFVDAMVIGMRSLDEVEKNVAAVASS